MLRPHVVPRALPRPATRRRAPSAFALAALLVGFAGVTPASAAAQPPAQPAPTAGPQPAPERVVANWKKLVGTWVADNSAFKNEQDTIDAYGIEWTWGIGEKSLVGRLYGLRDGKEVGTFWEFREFWHPGEGALIATQFGGDGRYGAGTHEIREDGSSQMLQTFYDPESHTTTQVGHRSTLQGDLHRTTSYDVSYDVDAAGTWTERRSYVWKRQR